MDVGRGAAVKDCGVTYETRLDDGMSPSSTSINAYNETVIQAVKFIEYDISF
ncbi:hypothetical protein L195_g061198 [Trifolium pratense]|uniref:Uncharacterized protein n=1 Tax=Trifolium pratense TaxID=57577 RepID=A0A2K3K8D8_TRIPR|nr:hypothetical protein L195_g061198 [Trifolium pratense]